MLIFRSVKKKKKFVQKCNASVSRGCIVHVTVGAHMCTKCHYSIFGNYI